MDGGAFPGENDHDKRVNWAAMSNQEAEVSNSLTAELPKYKSAKPGLG